MMGGVDELYRQRHSRAWRYRLWRLIAPPPPRIMNPREPHDFPLGRWNLYIGGAGSTVPGYVNVDLFAAPGVNVAADAAHLPFPPDLFTRIECDAVLEHARSPEQVMQEIARVLAPGGYAHVVAPFCHPFHAYPEDYRRFTPDGLRLLAPQLEPFAQGWRTGPTATVLLFVLEYVKLWFPWRFWRAAVHFTLGWPFALLRYADLLMLRSGRAALLGNHCYIWFRKPLPAAKS